MTHPPLPLHLPVWDDSQSRAPTRVPWAQIGRPITDTVPVLALADLS